MSDNEIYCNIGPECKCLGKEHSEKPIITRYTCTLFNDVLLNPDKEGYIEKLHICKGKQYD